jgi:hypothetical protein
MPRPSAERKAEQIYDDYLRVEFDDDEEAKAWLVSEIVAALKEAEQAGYVRAMRKRF